MPTRPSAFAERIMALQVGKSCTVPCRPDRYIRTARKHVPGAQYRAQQADGCHIVTRVA